MVRRSTWIVLAILVVLICIAILVGRRNAEQTEETTSTPPAKVLINKSSSDIKSLLIKKNTGESIEFEKNENNDWVFSDSNDQVVDNTVLENAITQFLTTSALSEINPAPPGQATGMDNPAYIIELRYSQGNLDSIQIGKQTQTESGYYLKTSENTIFVVNPSGVDAMINMINNPPVLSEE
ncbi:MAG: DUF4340 domain-containing protein [Anaerolineales bacterium]